MPPLLRQRQRPPGGGAVNRGVEHAAGGDARRQQRLRRHTTADELLRQLLVGDDADVRRTVAYRGAARIVRGHEAKGHGRAAVFAKHGHHQRRDHMDAHHGVKPLGLQKTVQAAGAPGQIALHRVILGDGAPHLLLGGHVARLVEMRMVAVHPGVPAGHQLGRLLGDEGQAVQHGAVRTAAAKRLGQRGSHGVVSAAGITGQYQYVHGVLSAAPVVAASSAAAGAAVCCSVE